VLFYSAIVSAVSSENPATTGAALPTLDLPLTISAVGAVISLLLLQVLTIMSVRTFVSGRATEIPSEYYTRNIVLVVANAVVGSVVFGLLVFLGSLLFVIPGIIAYVAFIFMLFYVAVDDENFIAALGDSWALTRGNWLPLFGLIVIIFVALSLVPGIVAAIVSLFVGAVAGPAASTLVSGAITLPFSLLTLGILAEAFVQLRGEATSAEL